MIPVLLNHDHTRVIGTAIQSDGRLLVEFTEDVRVTQEMFFAIFGDTGARLLETEVNDDGVVTIRKAEILEFSLSPESAQRR